MDTMLGAVVALLLSGTLCSAQCPVGQYNKTEPAPCANRNNMDMINRKCNPCGVTYACAGEKGYIKRFNDICNFETPGYCNDENYGYYIQPYKATWIRLVLTTMETAYGDQISVYCCDASSPPNTCLNADHVADLTGTVENPDWQYQCDTGKAHILWVSDSDTTAMGWIMEYHHNGGDYVSNCQPCPSGTYSAIQGITSVDQCLPCSFALTPGLSYCHPCNVGQYNKTEPAPCADRNQMDIINWKHSGTVTYACAGEKGYVRRWRDGCDWYMRDYYCVNENYQYFIQPNKATWVRLVLTTVQTENFRDWLYLFCCNASSPVGTCLNAVHVHTAHAYYPSINRVFDCNTGKAMAHWTTDANGVAEGFLMEYYHNGGDYVTKCDYCPTGTFSATPKSNVSDCMKCPTAVYPGSTSCPATCPSETYAIMQSGEIKNCTNCTKCAAGVNDVIPCTNVTNRLCACPAGQYMVNLTCFRCPMYTFSSSPNVFSIDNCTFCPTTNDTGMSFCPATCPTGTYAVMESNAIKNCTNCTKCAAGIGDAVACTHATNRICRCPAGQYFNNNTLTCANCSVNTYSGVPNIMSINSCLSCPPGSYALRAGLTACLTCPSNV